MNVSDVLSKDSPGCQDIEKVLTLIRVFPENFQIREGSFYVFLNHVELLDHFETLLGYILFGSIDEQGSFFDKNLIEIKSDSMNILDEFGPDFSPINGWDPF